MYQQQRQWSCRIICLAGRSVQRHISAAAAHYTLALLCFAPGMFAASTALLPSSFAMYAMTAAAAAVIDGRPLATIAAAAIGIMWGWIVAGLAFLPYALHVLFTLPLARSVPAALAALMLTAVPLIVTDRLFYGAWKVSHNCLPPHSHRLISPLTLIVSRAQSHTAWIEGMSSVKRACTTVR